VRSPTTWTPRLTFLYGSAWTSISASVRCQSVLDGTRNIVKLASEEKAFELPPGVSQRLYAKLERHVRAHALVPGDAAQEIPVGITDDRVQLGSHLIYFWESDEDFECGVRFLYPGLGKGEHCILFGHDEAIEKIFDVLRLKGYDSQELIRNLQLTVIRRQSSAQATLSDISDVVQAALRSGATAVRFLGNLGMGRDPLPAGEDDVLELECKATALISPLPCVIVCMYDVRTLSGRLILKGGLQSHHLAVCGEGVRENPYYAPDPNILPGISAVQ
jgi:DcmR-like sensory protein